MKKQFFTNKLLFKISSLLILFITFSSCEKTSDVESKYGKIVQKNLKRTYEYKGKNYILTYNLSDKNRVIVDEKTEDNLFLAKLVENNKNLSILYYGNDENPKIFDNSKEEDQYILKRTNFYTPSNNTNTLKATTSPAIFKLYEHINFSGFLLIKPNQLPWYRNDGALSSIPYAQSQYFKNSELASWTIGGNYKAIENGWVNSDNNDQASSCLFTKVSSSSVTYPTWNFGMFRLFSDAGYQGYRITRFAHESQFPIYLKNMTLDNMSSFVFFNISWNDEMSSYVAIVI